MPVQFFGQYLLAHNIVKPEELLDAIAYQDSQNLKLGEHAVKKGLLTEADAERINQLQQLKDLRFGDAAVELDLLTAAQVDELVTLQRNSHVYLGDAIIHQGYADPPTVEKALTAFKEEQAQYALSGDDVYKLGIPDEKLYAAAIDLTNKLLLRVWDVQNKTGAISTVTRSLQLEGFRVRINFTGQWNSAFILSAPHDVLKVAAKKLFKDDSPDDETCEDVLREFANVVCGNTAALLARMGRSTEISPPQTITGEVNLGSQKAICVTLVSPHGEMTLALTY